MNDGQYKKLAADSFIFAVGMAGSKLIMFFLLPIYTNALSDSEYGAADLVFTVAEVVIPFASLAIYNGLKRYGLSEKVDKRDALKCTTAVFIIGSLTTFILTPLWNFYSAVREWKWYLTAYVIAYFASNNVLVYLKISDKNKLYTVLSIFRAFILALVNIFLLLILNWSIKGYLAANIIAPAAVAVVGFFVGNLHLDLMHSVFHPALMRDMVRFSLPFIINDVSWWVIHASDKLMLEGMKNTSDLGIYAAASKIPLLLKVIISTFGQAWDLSVVREYEGSNNKKFYEVVYRYYILFTFGVCILLISFIKPFMRIYVGGTFKSAWQFIPMLLVSEAFGALDSFTSPFFNALKKGAVIMWPTILAGMMNVILNQRMIPVYGIWGAVFATAAAYAFRFMVHMIAMWRYYRFSLHVHLLTSLLFITFCQAVCVGFDWYGIFWSVCAIFVYIMISFRDYKQLAGHLASWIRSRLQKE